MHHQQLTWSTLCIISWQVKIVKTDEASSSAATTPSSLNLWSSLDTWNHRHRSSTCKLNFSRMEILKFFSLFAMWFRFITTFQRWPLKTSIRAKEPKDFSSDCTTLPTTKQWFRKNFRGTSTTDLFESQQEKLRNNSEICEKFLKKSVNKFIFPRWLQHFAIRS